MSREPDRLGVLNAMDAMDIIAVFVKFLTPEIYPNILPKLWAKLWAIFRLLFEVFPCLQKTLVEKLHIPCSSIF